MSVIDRAMIEQYRFPSVTRAIEMVSGMDLQRTYFKQNIVTARGILQEHYANKVLVMIDGVPNWNAVTGEAIIDRIDIQDVERIEITKGPASVQFGSNAYAGAINIVLRHDPAGSVAAHAGAGTESTYTAGALTTVPAGPIAMTLSANVRGDGGRDRAFVDERGRRDVYPEYQRGADATMQLGADYAQSHHTFLFNTARETESFLGNTPDLTAGLGRDQRSRGYLAAYEVSAPAGITHLHYRAAYDWSTRNFARTGDGLTRSNVEGWRLANSLFADVAVSPRLKLEGGIEHESRRSVEYTNYNVSTGRIQEDNGMRERSLAEWSAFGRAKYAAGDWRLNAGTRYTRNSIVGSNISSELHIDRQAGHDDRVSFFAGQSYRAPSLFELYFHTATNTVFGNTELRPETSTSFEAAWVHTSGPFEVQVGVYHAVYDDKIFRTRRLPNDPVDRSLVYVNGNRFSANGLELEVHARLQAATTFVTYTLVHGDRGDALPGTNHYNFRYVPQHGVTAGASTASGPWSFTASGTWRSSTHGPLSDVPSRSSLDASLGFTQHLARLDFRHGLALSNAFDARDEIPEFVRRNVNAVPSGVGRRIAYVIDISRHP